MAMGSEGGERERESERASQRALARARTTNHKVGPESCAHEAQSTNSDGGAHWIATPSISQGARTRCVVTSLDTQ